MIRQDRSAILTALYDHNGTASMPLALQDWASASTLVRGCPSRLTGLPRHDREASLQWVIRATAMDE